MTQRIFQVDFRRAVFIILIGLIFGPQINCYAIINFTSISGASKIDLGTATGTGTTGTTTSTTTSSSPIIYGGSAGDGSSCSGSSLCNNCSAALKACNEQRIHPAAVISFSFTSSTIAGYPIITTPDGLTLIKKITTSIVAKGATATISMTWGELCTALDEVAPTTNLTSDCSEDATKTIRVGIDLVTNMNSSDSQLGSTDDYSTVSVKIQNSMGDSITTKCESVDANSGICDFTLKPGDGKVYIQDIKCAENFPNTASNIQYTYIKAYYSSGGFDQVTPLSPSKLISIKTENTNPVLSSEEVTGLNNGTKYYFLLASVDQAGNVGYFIDTKADTHAETPQVVLGLVKEDMNCFIATAAFGSPLASELKVFRKFRDEILKTTQLGQNFINFYYNHGPYFAEQIKKYHSLQLVSRICLWPFWLFCFFALKIGFLYSLVSFLFAIVVSIFFIRFFLRKKPTLLIDTDV